MKKYPFDCYGIDQYLQAVNNAAWRILNKEDRQWFFGTEPVYSLNWYISSGRAPSSFIRKLLSIRPDVIARVLLKGGSDQEAVANIKKRIGYTEEVA